jgi:inner membrane protein
MDVVLGLVLIGIGLLLYIVEAFNPGFFIAVPGTVALILGVVALFFPAFYTYPLAWLGIIALSGFATWLTVRLYKRWAPPGKSTTTFTVDNIVGQPGVAATAIDAQRGTVRVHGESWNARSTSPVDRGAQVRVVAVVDNLTVTVEPVKGTT